MELLLVLDGDLRTEIRHVARKERDFVSDQTKLLMEGVFHQLNYHSNYLKWASLFRTLLGFDRNKKGQSTAL